MEEIGDWFGLINRHWRAGLAALAALVEGNTASAANDSAPTTIPVKWKDISAISDAVSHNERVSERLTILGKPSYMSAMKPCCLLFSKSFIPFLLISRISASNGHEKALTG